MIRYHFHVYDGDAPVTSYTTEARAEHEATVEFMMWVRREHPDLIRAKVSYRIIRHRV